MLSHPKKHQNHMIHMIAGQYRCCYISLVLFYITKVVNGATRITQKKRVTNRDFLSRMTMVAPTAAAPAARAPQDCVNLRLTQTPIGWHNPEFKAINWKCSANN